MMLYTTRAGFRSEEYITATWMVRRSELLLKKDATMPLNSFNLMV